VTAEAMTEAEREVYAYYKGGGKRGDLYKHFKCGVAGIQKPPRSHGYAYAAWMAGNDSMVGAQQ
jgi:hypothetical protein